MPRGIYKNKEKIDKVISALLEDEDRNAKTISEKTGLCPSTCLDYLYFLTRKGKVKLTKIEGGNTKGRGGRKLLWRKIKCSPI